MKTIFTLFFSCLIFYGCKNSISNNNIYSFDTFVFSHSQENEDFSIKLTTSDTIYIQKRFPHPKEIFYSSIKNNDAIKLDSFLKIYSVQKLDSIYFEKNLSDGESFKFYLLKDNNKKWVSVYGREGPQFLYEFGKWLIRLKDQLHLTQTKTEVDFGDLNYFLLPQVDPPTLKNGR